MIFLSTFVNVLLVVKLAFMLLKLLHMHLYTEMCVIHTLMHMP